MSRHMGIDKLYRDWMPTRWMVTHGEVSWIDYGAACYRFRREIGKRILVHNETQWRIIN